MSSSDRYGQKDIDLLKGILAESGFSEPSPDWIAVRLQDIAWSYEQHLKRRDTSTLTARIDYAGEELDAIKRTFNFLERWADVLTSEGVREDSPFGFGAWDDEPPRPASAEDVAAYLVDADFTEEEVETTRRVLTALAAHAAAVHGYHIGNHAARPIKNQHPEITSVIGGLVRMWCQAMKIPERDIKISASSGSQAMNFVEAGAGIFLEKLPQRETIEKHVIAYRNEKRSSLS
jgi:hypothetical protein